jgi:hypothetical protein
MGAARRVLTAIAGVGLVLGVAAAPAEGRRGAPEPGPGSYETTQEQGGSGYSGGAGTTGGAGMGGDGGMGGDSGMSGGGGMGGDSGTSGGAGGSAEGAGTSRSEGTARSMGSDAAQVCRKIFGSEPTGDLEMTTTPEKGGTVPAGGEIVLDLSWDADMLGGPQLHGWAVCVTIDGEHVDELSVGKGNVVNSGSLTRPVQVPATAKPGSEICTQAIVVGQMGDVTAQRRDMGGAPMLEEAISDCPCYTVAAAAPAPAPPPAAPDIEPRIVPAPPTPQVLPAVERRPEATLPVTGPKETLLLLAGLMLLLGGLAVIGGAPRPLPSRIRRTP